MTISVFAPASIGNVSVGFDVLGLAVSPVDGTLLGDVVTVEASEKDCLVVVGAFADKLPPAPVDNIVWHCLSLFNKVMDEQGFTRQPLKLTLDKKMPVGSGLGSSACSVVAALVGLNSFYQQCFSSREMLKMMGLMEAKISGSLHYDNVAPCYLGGLQLMVTDNSIITRRLPAFSNCYYIMAYPGIEVSTKAARDVLPDHYSRQDVIAYGQNLATFVDACHRQDQKQAFSVVKDVVAEPYRQQLLPGYTQARKYLLTQECLAVGISGSGPTIFCVCELFDQAQRIAQWLSDNYLVNEMSTSQGFVHICQIDEVGARAISLPA